MSKKYFEQAKGMGILATASSAGEVNMAIYAKPHFMEDGSVAFIMRNRLSYANIMENPQACYLFKEDNGFAGKRLYLRKIGAEKNTERLYELRRRLYDDDQYDQEDLFLVFFHLERERPLLSK
jgi:Pyridoxamine 5''-phosphate oxidase.